MQCIEVCGNAVQHGVHVLTACGIGHVGAHNAGRAELCARKVGARADRGGQHQPAQRVDGHQQGHNRPHQRRHIDRQHRALVFSCHLLMQAPPVSSFRRVGFYIRPFRAGLPAGGYRIRPYGSLAQIHYRTKSVHLQPSARKNGAKAAPHADCSRAGDQAALAGLVLGSTAAGRWVKGSAYFA